MDVNEVPLLEVRDLKVHFVIKKRIGGVKGVVRAVDGVSLKIRKGDVIALVGESGCGKTTLGKAIAGLVKPTEGTILWKGRDVWKMYREDPKGFFEYKLRVQYMPQDPYSAFNPSKTVFEILCTPLLKWKRVTSRAECIDYVLKILSDIKVTPPEEYIFRYPHQLSGGERQRILFALITSVEPDVVVADEPITAVDVALRVDLMNLMLEYWERRRVAYVFISHELASARYITEKTGGKIGVMYLGKFVEFGPPRAVIENPLHPYTQALVDAAPELDLEIARKKRLRLREVDIPSATNPPKGCRFHTRCPYAMDICTEKEPPLIEVENGRYVRCWLYAKR